MKKLDLKAHAKINLALDILGTRPDGYHEISTVMHKIALHDKICIKWIPSNSQGAKTDVTVEIGCNKAYLPRDGKNLAYKAASLVISRFGIARQFGAGKVRIDIKKQIPVGAGLGGGSADCAAVLCGLSEIWGLDLGAAELCGLGAELGSDVPFCVMAQFGTVCAVARGTGTALSSIAGLRSWLVLSKPPVSVSTADVYEKFDQINVKEYEKPDIDELVAALRVKNFNLIEKNMVNVLENVTAKAYPSVMSTKSMMIGDMSPAKAIMSGSGPTIAGFYRNKGSAEAAYVKMARLNKETFLTKTLEGKHVKF